jgi:hypothetical protein
MTMKPRHVAKHFLPPVTLLCLLARRKRLLLAGPINVLGLVLVVAGGATRAVHVQSLYVQ